MIEKYFSATLRVRYSETDQMGLVYHGNYLNWFEIGRTEMFRDLGQSYREAEIIGLKMPVLSISCNYLKPALYDDMIEIRTQMSSYTGVKLTFSYEIMREDELLVQGESSHCWTNQDLKPIHLKRKCPELDELMSSIVSS